jgi:hypothetical protein
VADSFVVFLIRLSISQSRRESKTIRLSSFFVCHFFAGARATIAGLID